MVFSVCAWEFSCGGKCNVRENLYVVYLCLSAQRSDSATVTDLIRGLRLNKKDELRYIQSAIVECKKEARSQDLDVKAGALLKLTYLAMFGQDMGWASFYTVEVMASPKFVNKRIGYMAASQGFRQDTDVLMLATNLMKKDIASSSSAEVSVALAGLGDVVTPDLARDLSHDLVTMLSHSKATVRKKAVLVMYKIFLQYPEALRSSYPKLRERLEDSDQSVVSATVNVIVELSRKNPKNYLPLAPALFELLTTSSNNWMLIKIIKLFATLTPLEPRLVKKLIPPMTDLIQSTSAMSLLYECINTVISGDMLNNPNSDSLAQLCIMKLRTFFELDDQNLKYVGLIAFTKVMESHPHMVSEHQDVVLQCIDDADVSIRMRALELVCLMPSKRTLPDIVKRLMKQLLPSSALSVPQSYRRGLITRLLKMCSSETYKHVENFDWYLAVLVDLVKIAKVDVASELCQEIMNVCVRVKSVREFAVPTLARLLCNREIMATADQPESNADVLMAAAWAVGEYSSHLEDPLQTLQNLLACPFECLGFTTQCTYLQAIPKLYCRWVMELMSFEPQIRSEATLQTQKLLRILEKFTTSSDIEVQRRSVELSALFAIAQQCIEAASEEGSEDVPQFFNEILPNLYLSGGDINPIAPTAQSHLTVPEDLDLDSWIVQPTPVVSPILEATEIEDDLGVEELSEGEIEERRKARKERNKDDPYYIQADSPTLKTERNNNNLVGDVSLDTIPIISLDEEQPLRIKRKKHRPKTDEPIEIMTDEMPEGITPDLSRPSSTAPTRAENNVLRVDGSKLSAFDLDATTHDEDHDVYRVVSEARKASKVTKKPEPTHKEATDKKKKKKKKKTETEDPPVPAPVNITYDDPSVVEVIKKKKKKSKVVEL